MTIAKFQDGGALMSEQGIVHLDIDEPETTAKSPKHRTGALT
ncbi:hypothetical protein AH14b_p11 (endogenous virus) [Pseudomonas phage phiAH14b]|nr:MULTISPECIES: hypothetical protein [unclassified Pseudomonas]AMW64566.1 hypothetical protein AH14b_p11 [Pseudomonas phage phiAH14b]